MLIGYCIARELAAIAAGELATAVPDSGSGDVH
jgi:hypothetical protein